MDESALRSWGVAAQSAGIDAFATDVAGFPIILEPALMGRIGHDDARLVSSLGANAAWLADTSVQTRLAAIVVFQRASRHPVRILARTGRPVEITNPLFGATLVADTEGAGDAVTRILADAARRQDNYLALAAAIPEWCEFRIYQLSSAPSNQIAWLPRNRRQRRRRVSAMLASRRR